MQIKHLLETKYHDFMAYIGLNDPFGSYGFYTQKRLIFQSFNHIFEGKIDPFAYVINVRGYYFL